MAGGDHERSALRAEEIKPEFTSKNHSEKDCPYGLGVIGRYNHVVTCSFDKVADKRKIKKLKPIPMRYEREFWSSLQMFPLWLLHIMGIVFTVYTLAYESDFQYQLIFLLLCIFSYALADYKSTLAYPAQVIWHENQKQLGRFGATFFVERYALYDDPYYTRVKSLIPRDLHEFCHRRGLKKDDFRYKAIFDLSNTTLETPRHTFLVCSVGIVNHFFQPEHYFRNSSKMIYLLVVLVFSFVAFILACYLSFAKPL
mmetsp:Transcript_11295/g.12412  ORF Transcript_11295/g.12412 Transcript_11295/m.12412 type:complete len:255 (-) Transcript_11295:391-1155(-)